MIAHFQSNPGCPYKDPDSCFLPNTTTGPLLSPAINSNLSPSFPSWIHGGVEEDEFPTPGDDGVDDDVVASPNPCDILELQEDSDLTDDDAEDDVGDLGILDEYGSDVPVFYPLGTDLNALPSSWMPPSPANQQPIVGGISLSNAEESLLSLIIENNLPKRMFPAIMDWAHFASRQGYDFSMAPMYPTILGRMIKKYINVSGGAPKSEIVHVENHAPMHVFRFDFLMQVTRLLSNPELMKDSLWGYNPLADPLSHERVYAEMNTGDFWKRGEEYVSNRKVRLATSDGLPHRLCPIIIFVDSTLVDRIGRLKVEPVLCSVGNISGTKRSSATSWFILGLIPPSPKSSKEAEADRKSVHTQHLQAKYYQSCLRSILQDLLAVDRNECGHKMWVPGQGYMWVHFKLSLVIGDTEGHDKICCHYCSYSSNIQRMSRDCDIPQSLGDNPDHECHFVDVEHIKLEVQECIPILQHRYKGTVKAAQNRLSSISQLPVWSALFDFDFCNCPHGIFGSCPFERLHAWQTGTMKDAMKYLFLMSDLPQSFLSWYRSRNPLPHARPNVNITESQFYIKKSKFEQIFRFLTMYSRRQSDREVPRTPFKNGVTDLTRLNGQEYPGLVMLTLVALKGLLHEHVDEGVHKDIVRVFWWMLVLNEMMNQKETTQTELGLMDGRIIEFLNLYKKVFGATAAAHSLTGLRKVKFHAPKHAAFYVRRYGSSDNFFGGNLESALKSTVKAPTKQTSRRHDHLAKELAFRQFERFVCTESKVHMNKSIESCGKQKQKRVCFGFDNDGVIDNDATSTTTNATEKPAGWLLHKPVFYLTREEDAGEWSTHVASHTWDHKVVYPNFVSKCRTDYFPEGGVEESYVVKLAQYAMGQGYKRIDCSCGASIPSTRDMERDIFRCHPSFHSYPYLKRPWHDWAMVKWSYGDDDDTEEYAHVAARLLLFGRLSKNEDESIPPKIVAVIHSLSEYHPPNDPILFFAKGDVLEEAGIDVVEVVSIQETAFVLPCVQDPGDDFPTTLQMANYFLVFPPRSEWTNIWESP